MYCVIGNIKLKRKTVWVLLFSPWDIGNTGLIGMPATGSSYHSSIIYITVDCSRPSHILFSFAVPELRMTFSF